jgi:hypothetical protein
MKPKNIPVILLFATLLGLAGCSSHSLYFGTDTSTGLKVSGTQAAPTDVSFSYQRTEIAIIPPKADGGAHSVYGGIDHDYSWSEGYVLTQVFATGAAATKAAENASSFVAHSATLNQTPKASQQLIFMTGTTFGLDMNLGAAPGDTSPALVLGYRRNEATIIPIKDDAEVASVYADISIVGGKPSRTDDAVPPKITPFSPHGVRIRQHFATGAAAEAIVSDTVVQAKLKEAVSVDAKPANP